MDTKKVIVSSLVLSFIGFGTGLVFKNSTELGFCLISEPTCINNLTLIGDGFFYGLGALAIIFLVLFFLPQAFPAWKKFAIWFIPLATLLFIFYPDPGSGDYFSPYPEQVFQWASGLYVLESLIVIAQSAIRERKK